jgi:hypothetical protein
MAWVSIVMVDRGFWFRGYDGVRWDDVLDSFVFDSVAVSPTTMRLKKSGICFFLQIDR